MGKGKSSGWKICLKVVEPERARQLYKYLGDGDSKGFDSVASSNPYGDNIKPYGDNIKIEKMQCINHVQTRMGTRLRR